MISFYPGPSRVHERIPRYVKEGYEKGIMSMNHRSEEFMAVARKTVSLIKERLSVPETYSVIFASSATECWEIIAQSLVEKESIHFHNGAFGEKWFDYTRRLRPAARAITFDRDTELDPSAHKLTSGEVICITQNETSNGTQVTNNVLGELRRKNADHLIAVDATSSMAGIFLDFKNADIWFASVQKCFGLPAGLAVMICSPRCLERVKAIGENNHYNSLTFLKEMIGKWQTPCTPNVLGIYLLMRTLKNAPSIYDVETKVKNRYARWEKFLHDNRKLTFLVRNPDVRSVTVLAIASRGGNIQKVKSKAKKAGFLLGEGYGALKGETFRIANFPAIRRKEIDGLMKVLRRS